MKKVDLYKKKKINSWTKSATSIINLWEAINCAFLFQAKINQTHNNGYCKFHTFFYWTVQCNKPKYNISKLNATIIFNR